MSFQHSFDSDLPSHSWWSRPALRWRYARYNRGDYEDPKSWSWGRGKFLFNFTLICFNNCIDCMVRLLSMEWHKVFLTVQWWQKLQAFSWIPYTTWKVTSCPTATPSRRRLYFELQIFLFANTLSSYCFPFSNFLNSSILFKKPSFWDILGYWFIVSISHFTHDLFTIFL